MAKVVDNPYGFKVGDTVAFVDSKASGYCVNDPYIWPWLVPGNFGKVVSLTRDYLTVTDMDGRARVSIYYNQVVPTDGRPIPKPVVQDPLKPRTFKTLLEAKRAVHGTPRTTGLSWIDKLDLCGLKYVPYGSCCGHYILQGFWGIRKKGGANDAPPICTMEEVKIAVKDCIGSNKTGMISCVLIQEQFDVYHETLEKLGFKVLSVQRNHNYPPPHDNYLMAYTYDQGKVWEKERAFG